MKRKIIGWFGLLILIISILTPFISTFAEVKESENEVSETLTSSNKSDSFVSKQSEEENEQSAPEIKMETGNSKYDPSIKKINSDTDSAYINHTREGSEKTNLVTDIKVNYQVRLGTEWVYIIKENEPVANPPSINVNAQVKIDFKWNIPKNSLEQMTTDDFFSFNLPTTHYRFDDEEEHELRDVKNELIGRYRVKNGQIVTNLTEVGLSKQGLVDGYFTIYGQAVKEGQINDWKVTEGLTMPPVTIGPETNNGDLDYPFEKPLEKYGSQVLNKNELQWTIYVNSDNEVKRFNKEPVKELKDAFLIDELAGNQVFKDMRIEAIVNVAKPDGKMSNLNLGWFTAQGIQNIESSGCSNLADFKEKLKTTGPGSYGVYNNTIVVYFGNLPGSGLTLPDYLINNNAQKIKELGQQYKDKGWINDDQINNTAKYYFENPELISFGVSIFTEASGEDTKFENTATLETSNQDIEADDTYINFQNIEGGVISLAPGTLKVVKSDDSNQPLANVQFKLQYKTSEGIYVDYKKNDKTYIETTNSLGEATFIDLDYQEYKLVEVVGLEGYGKPNFSPSDEFIVTNSDTEGIRVDVVNPKLTSVQVKKVWADGNNQDGIRPKSIQVQLLANGDKYGKSVELNDLNRWSFTWNELVQKESAQDIIYTIEEEPVLGYTTKIDAVEKGTIQLTNTHLLELTEVTGTKTWNDDNDQVGKRPDSIVVNLLADGEQVDFATVTGEDNWQYEFKNLPKYNKGKQIIYKITENVVPDYTTEVEGYNITNTYTPGKLSGTVTKHGEDNVNPNKQIKNTKKNAPVSSKSHLGNVFPKTGENTLFSTALSVLGVAVLLSILFWIAINNKIKKGK